MDHLLPWLALKSVPGIGNLLYKRLLEAFQHPEAVFKASRDELLAVDGITKKTATAVNHFQAGDTINQEIELAMNKGFRFVTMFDPEYPPLLYQIPDPPPYLYVYGRIPHPINSIAVVGSRNATGYGISTTKQLCRSLVSYGVTVTSGMALGIDTAAHQGAIDGNGQTIAVLGSGLGNIYPKENIPLFHIIAENGAVISEFPVMTDPEAHHFPQRNRIISGISLGTIVVEATRKSGSLITANLAADQGREVFAVPGSVNSFKSTGTHALLKQGAKLVEHARDVIEDLAPQMEITSDSEKDKQKHLTKQKRLNKKLPPLDSEEASVFDSLGPYPVHIDDIIREMSFEPGKLLSLLLQLELKGIIIQLPGKLFAVNEELK